MQVSEIAQAYDQITHLWTRKEFNRQSGILALKKALSFVNNKRTALDIGCGCSPRLIELTEQAGMITTGIDASGQMLALAKASMPHIQYEQTDICEYIFSQSFDFIYAWDSFWHIPLTKQRSVLKKIVAQLSPDGVFMFSFGAVEEAGEHTNAYMGPEMYYASLSTRGYIDLFHALNCQIKHFELDQHPQEHAYLIVQKAKK